MFYHVLPLFVILGAGLAAIIRNVPDQDLLDYLADNSAENEKAAVEDVTDCVDMRGSPGTYQVRSDGTQLACGVYIVGEPEAQIEIEFLDFKVDCQSEAVVGLLDGWEQEGHIFPPLDDLGKPGMRQRNYCGPNSPKQIFRSTANMALIQYRLPEPGSSFLIRLRFRKNPKPCNFIATAPEGQFKLRNYGGSANCSALIMYPLQIRLPYLNVGHTLTGNHASFVPVETAQCPSTSGDRVEIRGGSDIDVKRASVFRQSCGFHASSVAVHNVFCSATIIRLVSSGRYDNTVLVDYAELQPDAADLDTHICSAN